MITLGLILSLGMTPIAAQTKGIAFEPEETLFQQAVTKAFNERKLIFLDCYTIWCGPCKQMDREVFPLEEVGNFMNPSYISLKLNMEKGEGIELAKKLQVTAFPTYIVFNSNGLEIGRFLGGCKAKEFIEKVKKASIDSQSAEMDARFAAGERDEAFLYDYLATLSSAYKRSQCSLVAEALLEGKEQTFASDKRLADVFMRHISNPFCPAFIHIAKHPEDLFAAAGEKPVKMKLLQVLRNYAKSLINATDSSATFDQQRFDALLALMDDCKVQEREEIRLETLIALAEKQQEWGAYINYCTEYNNVVGATDLMLCNWCKPISLKCREKAPRQAALALLLQRIDDLESGRAQPQTMQGGMRLSGNLKFAMEKIVEVLRKTD
jgi:thioredoxin-related protein